MTASPHKEYHFEGSELVRDIVIGVSDGLTVPFALSAGLSGAVNETALILTAGVAEIAAGSIAMGLGGYLAAKTEADHYDAEERREREEIVTKYEAEINEVKEVFAEYGVSPELQDKLARQIATNPDKWVSFMMRYELGLEKPNRNRARQSALTISLSYIAGGLIPLAPYYFAGSARQGLTTSVIVTLLALFTFGYWKNKAIGMPALRGGLQVLLVGALAAGAAFYIAALFK